MNLKKKLTSGIATALLGMALIGGGTFAYFSDTEVTNNTFAAGTLDLSIDPEAVINVDNIKPRDKMNRSFVLENSGSLDIANIYLKTSYEVNDVKGDNTDDFGKHIRVNFFYNADKTTLGPLSPDQIVYQTTLFNLKNEDPDVVANKVFVPFLEERGGLKRGDSDELYVQFEFVDNSEDQNQFQGDSLTLNWKFEAQQGAGERK